MAVRHYITCKTESETAEH